MRERESCSELFGVSYVVRFASSRWAARRLTDSAVVSQWARGGGVGLERGYSSFTLVGETFKIRGCVRVRVLFIRISNK